MNDQGLVLQGRAIEIIVYYVVVVCPVGPRWGGTHSSWRRLCRARLPIIDRENHINQEISRAILEFVGINVHSQGMFQPSRTNDRFCGKQNHNTHR